MDMDVGKGMQEVKRRYGHRGGEGEGKLRSYGRMQVKRLQVTFSKLKGQSEGHRVGALGGQKCLCETQWGPAGTWRQVQPEKGTPASTWSPPT